MPAIATPITIPLQDIEVQPGTILTVHNVTWEQYEAITEELDNSRRTRRTTYLDGTLEIMSPLPAHERPHRIIGDIVKILLDAENRDWEDFGATTFRQKQQSAGLEPDTSFYVDANAIQLRECMRMDLDVYPPADLAIESDVTSRTTLEIYQRLKMPEIWVYREATLTIHLLEGDRYIESNTSRLFPNLPITTLIPHLIEQAFLLGSSRVLRELRQHLAQGE
jgi:Uma2 family endonuclease